MPKCEQLCYPDIPLPWYFEKKKGINFLVGHPVHLDRSVLVSRCPCWLQGGETVGQAAQRSCRCPIPGRAQGQVGWHSEQPALAEGVLAHGRGDWKAVIFESPFLTYTAV